MQLFKSSTPFTNKNIHTKKTLKRITQPCTTNNNHRLRHDLLAALSVPGSTHISMILKKPWGSVDLDKRDTNNTQNGATIALTTTQPMNYVLDILLWKSTRQPRAC
jgi:hypothetical protein